MRMETASRSRPEMCGAQTTRTSRTAAARNMTFPGLAETAILRRAGVRDADHGVVEAGDELAGKERPILSIDADVIYGHASVGYMIAKDLYATAGLRRMALKYDIKFRDQFNFERKPGVTDPLAAQIPCLASCAAAKSRANLAAR